MDKIICVSENTKKDLLNFYNLRPDKIEVIYNGSDHLIPVKNRENLEISVEKPYILYVGSRSKYKNFNLFIEAFSKSKKIYDNFDVICFGGGNFSKLEIDLLKKLKVLNKINLILGDDRKLKSCYKNASLFIYPSLYEGFGIPILEAMHEGCPTIVSDIPVFREILDNRSYFFDPKNCENLIFNMEKILFDSEIKNNLISLGRTDSKKYTWSECYNKTMKLYNLFK